MGFRSKPKLVRSIEKAFTILELVGEKKTVGVSEVASLLGWKKSTAHRLLSTLECLGYLDRSADTAKYRLSIRLLTLCNLSRSNLHIREEALPYMRDLADHTGEAVNLGIPDGTDVVFIEQVDSKHLLQPVAKVGSRAPLYCSAIGKVLLSSFGDEAIEELFPKGSIKKFTDNTISTLPELKRAVVKIRQAGYAIDEQEFHIGVRSIAAPIMGGAGKVVAGISVVGPTARLSLFRLKSILPTLKKAAGLISRSIGG